MLDRMHKIKRRKTDAEIIAFIIIDSGTVYNAQSILLFLLCVLIAHRMNKKNTWYNN